MGNQVKTKTINQWLIWMGVLVLATGLWLHIGYPRLINKAAMLTLADVAHVVTAAAVTVLAVWHGVRNRWLLRTMRWLSGKGQTVTGASRSKSIQCRQRWQRGLMTVCVAGFLATLITGVCILLGWHPKHSHIWTWHYALGLAWVLLAVLHALSFKRR